MLYMTTTLSLVDGGAGTRERVQSVNQSWIFRVAGVTSGGRQFHTRGPATENARLA